MTILVDNPESIKWWGGLERLEIDINDPVDIDSTCQFYDNRWIRYNVVTKVERQDTHVVRYHISYCKKENLDLPPQPKVFWGTHILILNKDEDFGESFWNDKPGPGWRLEKLIEKKRKITTTKLQRDQQKFRRMLLATYDRCALTDETRPEALEAAHIVPVKYGGQEVLPNGILLRADLHRLYDADPAHFDICPKQGKVLVHQPYKSFDLTKAGIPGPILSKIAGALRERASLCPARKVPKNPAQSARR